MRTDKIRRMRDLYFEEGVSLTNISYALNVPRSTIRYYLFDGRSNVLEIESYKKKCRDCPNLINDMRVRCEGCFRVFHSQFLQKLAI